MHNAYHPGIRRSQDLRIPVATTSGLATSGLWVSLAPSRQNDAPPAIRCISGGERKSRRLALTVLDAGTLSVLIYLWPRCVAPTLVQDKFLDVSRGVCGKRDLRVYGLEKELAFARWKDLEFLLPRRLSHKLITFERDG